MTLRVHHTCNPRHPCPVLTGAECMGKRWSQRYELVINGPRLAWLLKIGPAHDAAKAMP